MNPHDATLPPACADDAALEALVSGTLAPDRERALEAHLGGCAACRSRLDALAASPENWSTVREQLSAGAEADGEDAAPPIPALASLIQKILAPSDDDRMLGRLGPYEITGIIGSGGMGIVLKGHDRALDRFVAIKLLSPHLASSGAARQRFLREAKAAAAVVHDNVIAIHGVDEFAGLPYLVMPYCRGTTLEKRIRDAGPMNLREILRVGLQTARGLAAAWPSPAAPAPDHQATPRTFLDSLRRIMSDQRILSIAALVIFLMALLLPWPILALGRAEPALTLAVIATLTSLLFAWLGRRDSLGRLVLTLAGTAAILGGAVVAFWVLSDSILSGGRHNAERVAAITAQNLAKQAQMEAIARQQNAPVTIAPMSIPVPSAPRVASGPDPMPVVGWPGHNAPAEMPVLTATVPSSTPAPAAMGGADLMPPEGISLSLAGPFGTMKTELADSLDRLERWLAEHPHEAVAEVTVRRPGALPDHQTKTLGPHADLVLPNLEGASTWQKELTTGFLGRSLAEVIRAGGIPAPPTNAATEIGVQTRVEDGDGFQQEIYVSGEPATGAVTTKERRVRYTLDGTFRTLNRTLCKDFREAAPGIWLPHRIDIDSFDIDPNQPENVIPKKACSVTVVVKEWRPLERAAPAAADVAPQPAETPASPAGEAPAAAAEATIND